MAEAVIVNIVIGKLANIIAKEIQFLGGVGQKVRRAQRELTRIQSCLRDADSKHQRDERVQNWLNELRDVAYHIEDAIDMFFIKVECNQNHSFLQRLKNKPRRLYFLHKLGTKLNSIQNELEEISKSRVAYGIIALQDSVVGEPVILPLRRTIYSEVDETEVVGLHADRDNILKLLRPEKTPRRSVITIVGTGGLGKTTLAHMIYKSARAEFEYHIMLSVSQQFSPTELLRGMLRQLIDYVPKEELDVEDLMSELKKKLSRRRYLITLDDVWQVDVWNQLKNALPDDKNGSRVLITSRSIDVAKSADPDMAPYELNLLDDQKSLDLLLKKALPNQEPSEELLNLANELSKKCKGLPLALVVLGGILLTKHRNYHAWERVLRTMYWHSEGTECMDVLAMSYENMPYYLKACFLYLAVFPEDYQISAGRLLRMWVAEGFIPQEGTKTMEEIAEDYLYELFQRSMIQVSSRSENGSIKYFQVHGLLHDLAIYKARHENFVTIFSLESDDKRPNKYIRRASLQAQEKNSRFIEYIGQNTHSLLLFVSKYSRTSLHCSNFRLLEVLEIVGSKLDQFELKSLDELIYLKYLGLRRLSIDLSSCSFHRMKSLETLDVRESIGLQPCDDFWSISTLRHVQGNLVETFFDRPLPIAIDLRNIQTLKWVTFQRSFDVKLPNLRTLGIRNETNEWVSITNLLQTLPVLVSLGIISAFGYALPMDIIYPKALPHYQNLQSLYLDGEWPKNVNVEARLLPLNLVKLTLEWSLLNHNPMPELGKLNSLKKLRLRDVFPVDWEGLIICPEGFPVLQYLTVSDTYIKELAVAQGVMPKLTNLQVEKITMVHLPPELQHVTVETL